MVDPYCKIIRKKKNIHELEKKEGPIILKTLPCMYFKESAFFDKHEKKNTGSFNQGTLPGIRYSYSNTVQGNRVLRCIRKYINFQKFRHDKLSEKGVSESL